LLASAGGFWYEINSRWTCRDPPSRGTVRSVVTGSNRTGESSHHRGGQRTRDYMPRYGAAD